MKKVLKNMLPMFLILIVALSAISPLQLRAAIRGKAQNIEMYVGEAYEYTNFNKVKNIKNTKKDVVETAKRKDNDKYVVFQTKKAGKAKITVNTQAGTVVFNLTVKAPKFEYKFYNIGSGEILAEVANKNKDIFEDGKFKYTLKGADGTEYASDEVTVQTLIPNSKSYARIYFNSSSFEPDMSKLEMKSVSLSRSPNRKYVNAGKKLVIKDEVKSQEEDKVVVSTNTKNTGKVPMSGYLHVVFYDPSGAPIDVISRNINLKAGSFDTNDFTCYLKMINYETKQRVLYDHYEIIKNVYTSEFKK